MANSTTSSVLNCASLANFFIFTPKDLPEGKEHEKILFYLPQDDAIEVQTKHIGLMEAFVTFTKQFSPDKPCEVVHFEKHVSVVLEPEPNYWMVLKVANPTVTKIKDGTPVVEYKEHELDDVLLQTILSQIYQCFRLFNGSFGRIVEQKGESGLKEIFSSFLPLYLATIKFDQIDLFSTLDGVHFLPVDRNIYLQIQCFIHLIESTFPVIRHTCFLYNDHLVWSGLELDDMRILYRYVVNHLNPVTKQFTNAQYDVVNATAANLHGIHNDAFLSHTLERGNPGNQLIPLVFVGKKEEPLGLMVYQFRQITCLFLVGEGTIDTALNATSTEPSLQKNIGPFISSQLQFLSPILEENYQRKQGFEEQYRYIYFNHMNLALKTSLKEKGAVIPREVMNILNHIHSDFEKSSETVSEVLIRTQSDKWIVGRKSDQREFFVIFEHKNSHLIEISEEVKKLSTSYFNNIFID